MENTRIEEIIEGESIMFEADREEETQEESVKDVLIFEIRSLINGTINL